MAQTSQHRLSFSKETTFGTTNASLALQIVRHTGETFAMQTSSKPSDEIRSDRQIADIIRTGWRVSGELSIEFSAGTYDEFMAAALESAGWSTPVSVNGTNISCSASDNSINSASSAFGSLNVGQWIKQTGWTGANAVNNGYFKITSKPSNAKIIVQGRTLIDSSAGDSITVNMGAQIVNGVTKSHYSFERQMTDLTNVRQAYRGVTCEGMRGSAVTGQPFTGSFSFVGRDETNETATIGNGTYTAAGTTPILSGVDNVLSVMYDATGSVLADVPSTEFSFDIRNNLRDRNTLGDGGPVSFGDGEVAATGTARGYFDSNAAYTKFLSWQNVGMAMVVEDPTGAAYVFDFPRCKFTSATRNAPAKNSDIMRDFGWSAYRHPTEGVTVRVVRF